MLWLLTEVILIFEPHHEKTCLRGFRPGKTQMDAQADLCLCCSHIAIAGFLMMRLIVVFVEKYGEFLLAAVSIFHSFMVNGVL